MNKTTDVAKIEQETKAMMTQIMSINKSIDHSKYMVGGLKDKDHSWLAKLTGKAKDEKIADLAVALGSTNVAVADLSKVVQKAMILSQHSMIHSQTMTETISKMLSVGLQDVNGRIVQLSDQDREIAEYILKSAESFTKNQEKIAGEFNKTSDQVGSLEDRIEKIQREQNEFISAQQKKTEDLQNALDAKSSRLEDKVDTSIKELETKVDSKVNQCENLIKTHKDELEKQSNESKRRLDIFTQQLKDTVDASIKEVESKVAGGVNQCENLINNFKGELNSQRDNLESIVTDAGKNLRQETEKLLQQQQEELEELKSQLQAKRKIQPLSIVTLIVSIAALLVAIITFYTGNPATDIEAPTSTTMEIETTTEVPAAQQ
ncbi:MAG: hypothetical protein IKB33_04280 [Spirochaetaceae bacterium]|nr:hypothetical protein [Spirochaetaceae bacterium]